MAPRSMILKSFLVGGFAGMVSKSCLAPVDRVKIIFQATDRAFSFRRAWNLGQEIYRRNGFDAFFRGNSATILRVMPYAGIQHSSFDVFRSRIMQWNATHRRRDETKDDHLPGRLSKCQMVVAGSLAGGLSVVCTYPLDILRARLVVQQVPNATYRGLVATASHMYAQEVRDFGSICFLCLTINTNTHTLVV